MSNIGMVGTIAMSLALFVSLAPSAARGDDWPQMGFDPARSRSSTEISGGIFDGGGWTATIEGGRIVASPAVADGLVVAASTGGRVHAFSAADGRALWRTDVADEVYGSPAIARGLVVLPAGQEVRALRLATGELTWRAELSGQVRSSPTVIEAGVVLSVGVPAKRVARLDLRSGALAWQTAAGVIADVANSSAAIAGDLLSVGSTGGRYYGFSIRSGAPVWTYDTGGTVNMSAPLVRGADLFMLAGGRDTRIHRIDASTGRSRGGWPVEIPDPQPAPTGRIVRRTLAVSSPVDVGALVVVQVRFDYFVASRPNGPVDDYHMREYVVAVEPEGPRVAWQAPAGSRTTRNPNDIPEQSLCPTPAVFHSGRGALLAISSSLEAAVRVVDPAAGGSTVWSAPIAAPGRSSPVLANGILYVATDAGTVHAFQSNWNRAPLAPARLERPSLGPAGEITLSWELAQDPDGGAAKSYQVRMDDDGEVLEDWTVEMESAGTDAILPEHLPHGRRYAYAVRSRDALGAWSAWSNLTAFGPSQEVIPAPVSAPGSPATPAGAALAAAPSGSPPFVPVVARVDDVGQVESVTLPTPSSYPATPSRWARAERSTAEAEDGLSQALAVTLAPVPSGGCTLVPARADRQPAAGLLTTIVLLVLGLAWRIFRSRAAEMRAWVRRQRD